MLSLPTKQAEVFGILKARAQAGLPMPSRREIAKQLRVRSSKTVNDHLSALRRKGLITWERGKARTLRICPDGDSDPDPTEELTKLPIYGAISASFPVAAEAELGEEFKFNFSSLGYSVGKNSFALLVRGDSMRDRHILDGDTIIVERDAIPRSGDVVAALIDQESTLKTFVASGGESWLKAENPAYPDLIPLESLEIQGVARAIVRHL